MKLLVAALAALALAGPAAACTPRASQAYLESRLVCIQCHTTLDESDSTFAREMKAEVARQIRLCRTNSQIIDSMVAQFGPSVLSTPQTHGFDLIAWVLPIGGILVAAGALAVGARTWSRSRGSSGLVLDDLGPEDARRVDDALERFE